jgi:hypothetical protein
VAAAEKLSEEGRRPTTTTTAAGGSYTGEKKITDELRVRKT